ncbi:hypothetical protein OQA88_5053 [Cercophora sp. LCS_1]
MAEGPYVKCVVVGDPGVGKTSLIASYETGCFPYQNIPLVIDKYTTERKTDEWSATICIWDTASGPEHDVMRPLSYQDTNAVVICYSTSNPDSFYNVRSKWWPEAYHNAYGVPIILVGTKTDVRLNLPWDRPRVTTDQGQELANEIGAVNFVECSALTHENRDWVFHYAAE